MASLYKSRDERVQDILLAFTNVESSVRFSLTHGGRYLPYSDFEKRILREEKAWAQARLAIDKVMRLPNIRDYFGKSLG